MRAHGRRRLEHVRTGWCWACVRDRARDVARVALLFAPVLGVALGVVELELHKGGRVTVRQATTVRQETRTSSVDDWPCDLPPAEGRAAAPDLFDDVCQSGG